MPTLRLAWNVGPKQQAARISFTSSFSSSSCSSFSYAYSCCDWLSLMHNLESRRHMAIKRQRQLKNFKKCCLLFRAPAIGINWDLNLWLTTLWICLTINSKWQPQNIKASNYICDCEVEEAAKKRARKGCPKLTLFSRPLTRGKRDWLTDGLTTVWANILWLESTHIDNVLGQQTTIMKRQL